MRELARCQQATAPRTTAAMAAARTRVMPRGEEPNRNLGGLFPLPSSLGLPLLPRDGAQRRAGVEGDVWEPRKGKGVPGGLCRHRRPPGRGVSSGRDNVHRLPRRALPSRRGRDSLVWGHLREFCPKKGPQQARGSVESSVPTLCPCSGEPPAMAEPARQVRPRRRALTLCPRGLFSMRIFSPRISLAQGGGIQQDTAAPSPPASGEAHPGGQG